MYVLKSEDVDSGTIYNGTWNMTTTVQGTNILIAQNFNAQDFYWMWSACNTMKIQCPPNAGGVVIEEAVVNFDVNLGKTDNIADIIAGMVDDIQDALDNLPVGYERNVSATYDSYNKIITFQFDQPMWVLWGSDDTNTFKYIVNRTIDEVEATVLHFSSVRMTLSPTHICAVINESNTEIAVSNTSRPTLLLATSGEQLTGQQFNIKDSTLSLNISFYLINVPISPVPLTDNWVLAFKKYSV